MRKAFVLFLLFLAAFAYAGRPGPGPGYAAMIGQGDVLSQGQISAVVAMAPKELSEQEIQDLLWMREEEKLARDVYLTLYEKWGLAIFNNIARSEQNHMDALKALIDKYNLTDPVEETGDARGVFKNQELQELYNTLVEQGSQSLIDALKVGATIEDVDIKDLQERIARTDNEDIKMVYENLMRGSRNHLRAFVSQLEANGAAYEPQYISKEEYNKIISSGWEMGTEGAGAAGRMNRGGVQAPTNAGKGRMNARRYAIMNMEQVAQRIPDAQTRERLMNIVQELNQSEGKITIAEERIQKRSRFMRFLFGGDYKAAEEIEQEIARIQNRIREMNQLMAGLDNETQTMLREQIQQMEQEIARLQELAQQEKKSRGLLGWIFRF